MPVNNVSFANGESVPTPTKFNQLADDINSGKTDGVTQDAANGQEVHKQYIGSPLCDESIITGSRVRMGSELITSISAAGFGGFVVSNKTTTTVDIEWTYFPTAATYATVSATITWNEPFASTDYVVSPGIEFTGTAGEFRIFATGIGF